MKTMLLILALVSVLSGCAVENRPMPAPLRYSRRCKSPHPNAASMPIRMKCRAGCANGR